MNAPATSATVTTGHADRPVEVRTVGGRDIVVKRYLAADGARIHAEHRLLWDSPLGAGRTPPGLPEPLGWDEARQELLMERVAGVAVGARGELGRTIELTAPCARLLADLHGCGVRFARRRGARRLVSSLSRKRADLSGAHGEHALMRTTRVLAQAATWTAAHERLVASHGDWSPRNVLVDADASVRLIDLDRLQMAGAGRDVAYWGAWVWTTLALAGDDPTWAVADAFEAAYTDRRPGAAEEMEATRAFHRSAGLARIAHGWSALADDPVLRSITLEEAERWAYRAAERATRP